MLDTIGDDYWRKKFQRELVDSYRWVEAKARSQERAMKKEEESGGKPGLKKKQGPGQGRKNILGGDDE